MFCSGHYGHERGHGGVRVVFFGLFDIAEHIVFRADVRDRMDQTLAAAAGGFRVRVVDIVQ